MRWLAPVALAVVFAWAGGAKFADLKGTQEGFAALGLSQPEPRAIQVAAFEIATAVLLIVAPIGGAMVALVLLTVFTVLIVRLLRAGTTAPLPLLRRHPQPPPRLDRRRPQRRTRRPGAGDPGVPP